MSKVATIGLDIAKHVFHAHGVDGRGLALFSKRLSLAALSRWRHVAERTIGLASLLSLAIRFG